MMMSDGRSPRDGRSAEEEARRRTLRKATLYVWGLGTAAVLVGALGSAAIAWLALPELPFLTAWLLVVVLLVIGVGIVIAFRAIAEHRRGAGADEP